MTSTPQDEIERAPYRALAWWTIACLLLGALLLPMALSEPSGLIGDLAIGMAIIGVEIVCLAWLTVSLVVIWRWNRRTGRADSRIATWAAIATAAFLGAVTVAGFSGSWWVSRALVGPFLLLGVGLQLAAVAAVRTHSGRTRLRKTAATFLSLGFVVFVLGVAYLGSPNHAILLLAAASIVFLGALLVRAAASWRWDASSAPAAALIGVALVLQAAMLPSQIRAVELSLPTYQPVVSWDLLESLAALWFGLIWPPLLAGAWLLIAVGALRRLRAD